MHEPTNHTERLDETLNWVSDQDLQWWPFLFLRPEPHQIMSPGRVATVSLLLGVFAGMLANLAIAFTSADAAPRLSVSALPAWLTVPVATSALFFVFFQMTFAASWNRRARRLAPSRVRARRG